MSLLHWQTTDPLHPSTPLLPVTYPLLGAEDDAGHVEDHGQGHLSDLTQLLLLVGHADGNGVDQNQRVHALGAVLLAVEHGGARLAAQLVARQQERTWGHGGEDKWKLIMIVLKYMDVNSSAQYLVKAINVKISQSIVIKSRFYK